jgi:hypothetical protein
MTKRLLLAIVILGILIFMLNSKKQISDKDYALQVLDQYIRYYCPRDGDCSRGQALARAKKDWPEIYNLGFFILEENE